MKTMDISGAAEYLLVSADTVRDMAAAGILPAAKIGPTTGKCWVFTDESLDQYLRAEIARQTAARKNNGAGIPGAPLADAQPASSPRNARRRAIRQPPVLVQNC